MYPVYSYNNKQLSLYLHNNDTDKSDKLQFHRVGFLGEVWFSRSYWVVSNESYPERVYEVKDVHGSLFRRLSLHAYPPSYPS